VPADARNGAPISTDRSTLASIVESSAAELAAGTLDSQPSNSSPFEHRSGMTGYSSCLTATARYSRGVASPKPIVLMYVRKLNRRREGGERVDCAVVTRREVASLRGASSSTVQNFGGCFDTRSSSYACEISLLRPRPSVVSIGWKRQDWNCYEMLRNMCGEARVFR